MTTQRIIVVDDSQLTLQITRDILENAGYDVSTAASGFDVCKCISDGAKPSIMLIDVTMPHIEGDSLVRVLKTNAATKDIPIIFYSSRPEAELQILVEASGANGYLTKTASPAELLTSIQQLLT